MANLVARAMKEALEPERINLPKVAAQVKVDGSMVSFVINMDEIAQLALEREGEREQNGIKVKYTKDPGIMLTAVAKDVEVIQRNPDDGLDYLLRVDFALGSNFGAYAHITKSKVIGVIKDGAGVVPPEPEAQSA